MGNTEYYEEICLKIIIVCDVTPSSLAELTDVWGQWFPLKR